MICQKEFTVSVVLNNPVHFVNMVPWGTIVPNNPGFTEINAPAFGFDNFLQLVNINADGADPHKVSTSFPYAAGAITLGNVQLGVTNYAVGVDTNPTISLIIRVNLVPVLSIECFTETGALGVFNFPFAIPAGVGNIQVEAEIQRDNIGFSQGQFACSVEITPA